MYGSWGVVDEGGEWCEFWEVGVDDVKEFLSGYVVEHVGEVNE
jgi:hypothetical protein